MKVWMVQLVDRNSGGIADIRLHHTRSGAAMAAASMIRKAPAMTADYLNQFATASEGAAEELEIDHPILDGVVVKIFSLEVES